ncbi:RNA helicase [Pseudocyphellaria aurata]|nr:RNA helicase [Pseudocyphellaria aurata]
MPAAERNLVDCLYSVIRKKSSPPFVQRPHLFGAVQSRIRDVQRGKSVVFPVLLQKRCWSTDQSRRKTPNQSRRETHFQKFDDGATSRSASAPLGKQQLLSLIVEKLDRIERSLDNGEFPNFASDLKESIRSWDGRAALPELDALRKAYSEQGERGLNGQLQYLRDRYIANKSLSKSDFIDQKKIADLRFPTQWYPKTQEIQRSLHLHVGPTNSGKTYHALKRLEQAESGIYASPLRLLAHEVYMRLNANGTPCHLVTGDERMTTNENATMTSCTVEMVPINKSVDVAVIDEIQMIGCRSRGWAWTQALLGLSAKELHLCGEERTVPLIRELAALMGERLEVHYYKRLSPLKLMPSSLKGNLENIQKGDCIVVFSKKGIHEMKKAIEKRTRKRVAIIYGDLPPETRSQQARLFNEPDNDYDFLVASDAIGMGLNLSIKRVIFESTLKSNGTYLEKIGDHQIKQIGGRAGRYRAGALIKDDGVSQHTAHDATPGDVGLVTSLHTVDFTTVIKGMQNEPTPVMTAGLFPTSEIISRFAAYFPPETPFSYILSRIDEISLMHPRFHKCDIKDHVRIADILEPVKNLTVNDRLIFCASPVDVRSYAGRQICRVFADCVANSSGGALLDIKELNLDILDQKAGSSPSYQAELEILHKALTLYLWLGYRFPGVFHTQEMALYVKELVRERIQEALAKSPQGSGQARGRGQQVSALKTGQNSPAGDLVNGEIQNVSVAANLLALPPQAGVAGSAHQVDNMPSLKYLPVEVSRIKALEGTA